METYPKKEKYNFIKDEIANRLKHFDHLEEFQKLLDAGNVTSKPYLEMLKKLDESITFFMNNVCYIFY